MGRYRLGVDVGGTFTDLVLFDETTQELSVHKLPNTPDDRAQSIVTGVSDLLSRQGVTPEELAYFAQGSTVAINTMLEGKTARVGVITTQGFRDLLELRRQRRPSLYDLFFQLPPLLVPRHLRVEVPERVNAQGDALIPLDENSVHEALEWLARSGVEAVAVCFLFSFLNPEHELRVAQIASEAFPDLPVWLSHQVLPEFREFERLGTTVGNAALGPVIEGYLGSLGQRLAEIGIRRPPYIMQSNGGIVSPQSAIERPVNTLFSGPSAGVVGGLHVARQTGAENAITLDMGGTSTDVCLIAGGAISMVYEKEIAGTPIRTPMVDVNSVGAGGGSIAWVDAGGRIKVGPRSAGANPGPACYGQGGDQPTVTDANVALGRLSPRELLAGRMAIYPELAVEAIRRHVAEPLGLDVMEAASGIIQIVNTNMMLATRTVSVQRGHDPREFTMVAFGGAGPLHASVVARELGIPSVVVPTTPGILCALGLLATDMRTDYVQAFIEPLPSVNLEDVNDTLRDLNDRAWQWLRTEQTDVEGCVVSLSADMRYVGQNYELPVDAPPAPWTEASLQTLRDRFHQAHQQAYGYHDDQSTAQLVNLRATALAPMPPLPAQAQSPGRDPDLTPSEVRDVWWNGGFVSTAVYQRSRLPIGGAIEGPAVIEQMDSTTLIAPGEQAEVDGHGNLIIQLGD